MFTNNTPALKTMLSMYMTFIAYLLNEYLATSILGLSKYIGHELLRGRAYLSFISVPGSLIQALIHSEHAINVHCHVV